MFIEVSVHVYIQVSGSLLCFIKTKEAYVCIQWDKLIKSKLDLFIIQLCMKEVFSHAAAVASNTSNRHMLIIKLCHLYSLAATVGRQHIPNKQNKKDCINGITKRKDTNRCVATPPSTLSHHLPIPNPSSSQSSTQNHGSRCPIGNLGSGLAVQGTETVLDFFCQNCWLASDQTRPWGTY